jgi:hypothetical protein
MKEAFFGYYAPTEREYAILWKEAIIVLDANVLLNLYRLPATARDEFITVLESLRERLWVPHQVALEFQRSRLTVIATERKATEDTLGSAEALIAELKKKVEALEIDKHGLDLQVSPLIADLERANNNLINAIKAVHQIQPDITASDPVRERLDKILTGKVGSGPATQEELDALIKGGEERFAEKVPPGYADAAKEKNPNLATFFHDQIKYQRKFGDLILWRQVIHHAKSKGIKSVLLVTADRKEDWWWREQGKIIGVHPELVREMRRLGDVDLFWMYSSVQFLEHAKTYAKASVSDKAVAELKEVSDRFRRGITFVSRPVRGYREIRESAPRILERFEYQEAEASVYDWLTQKYGDVHRTELFPDFVVDQAGKLHGFEIKSIRDFVRIFTRPNILQTILRGYVEVKEGRLSSFTLILVIRYDDFDDDLHDKLENFSNHVGEILRKYPITEIIVGGLGPGGHFEPLIHQGSPEAPDIQP